jgi:hypothetical protein
MWAMMEKLRMCSKAPIRLRILAQGAGGTARGKHRYQPQRDLADGWGRVMLPEALDRKHPGAPADWRWQWVFPPRRLAGRTHGRGKRDGIMCMRRWSSGR